MLSKNAIKQLDGQVKGTTTWTSVASRALGSDHGLLIGLLHRVGLTLPESRVRASSKVYATLVSGIIPANKPMPLSETLEHLRFSGVKREDAGRFNYLAQ